MTVHIEFSVSRKSDSRRYVAETRTVRFVGPRVRASTEIPISARVLYYDTMYIRAVLIDDTVCR